MVALTHAPIPCMQQLWYNIPGVVQPALQLTAKISYAQNNM